jgi:hypothetical protein
MKLSSSNNTEKAQEALAAGTVKFAYEAEKLFRAS